MGFVIGITVAILDIASVKGWAEANCYKNGLLLGAVVCVLVGVLSILGNLGSFNIFSYYPGRKTINGYKESYTQYIERKRAERVTSKYAFIVYLIDSLIMICFAIISALF